MLNRIFTLFVLFLLGSCSEEPQLRALPADGVVLAFGDSLTFGTGASSSANYPAVLEQMIGRKVVNSGIPGEVSANGVKRLPGVLEETKPDLVVLIHGGNDMLRRLSMGHAASNLEAMIEMSRQAGAEVVMLGVPKPGLILSSAAFYESVSEKTGTPIDNDAIADILQYSTNKSDPVHPNAKGYRELASKIADLLSDAGAIRD